LFNIHYWIFTIEWILIWAQRCQSLSSLFLSKYLPSSLFLYPLFINLVLEQVFDSRRAHIRNSSAYQTKGLKQWKTFAVSSFWSSTNCLTPPPASTRNHSSCHQHHHCHHTLPLLPSLTAAAHWLLILLIVFHNEACWSPWLLPPPLRSLSPNLWYFPT